MERCGANSVEYSEMGVNVAAHTVPAHPALATSTTTSFAKHCDDCSIKYSACWPHWFCVFTLAWWTTVSLPIRSQVSTRTICGWHNLHLLFRGGKHGGDKSGSSVRLAFLGMLLSIFFMPLTVQILWNLVSTPPPQLLVITVALGNSTGLVNAFAFTVLPWLTRRLKGVRGSAGSSTASTNNRRIQI